MKTLNNCIKVISNSIRKKKPQVETQGEYGLVCEQKTYEGNKIPKLQIFQPAYSLKRISRGLGGRIIPDVCQGTQKVFRAKFAPFLFATHHFPDIRNMVGGSAPLSPLLNLFAVCYP